MITRVLLASATAMLLGSCAHHRGEVAMKANAREAHIGLGSDEVKPGDKVVFYNEECRRGGFGRTSSSPGINECRDVTIGKGTVTRNLGKDYSVVKVEPGVEFKEGTKVKKAPSLAH